MKDEEKEQKKPYMTPDLLCVHVEAATMILTVSGGINDVSWEDE